MKYSLLDEYDYTQDYVPWTCNNDKEIEDNKRIDPETGEVIDHPHGWEPSNNTEQDSEEEDKEEESGDDDLIIENVDDVDSDDFIDDGWDEEGTTIFIEDDEADNEDEDVKIESV